MHQRPQRYCRALEQLGLERQGAGVRQILDRLSGKAGGRFQGLVVIFVASF